MGGAEEVGTVFERGKTNLQAEGFAMTRFFVVGEKEKHEVEVDVSHWTNKVTVRIDGKNCAETTHPTSWKRGTFCKIKVGDEETHEVELKWSGIFPSVRYFVDGKPHLRVATIRPKMKLIDILLVGLLVIAILYIALDQMAGVKFPPYIEIENRNVSAVFKASNGALHRWSVSLDAWEEQTNLGWYTREVTKNFQYTDLRDNKTGTIYHVIDFRPFVIENNFRNVVSDLYQDLGGNDQAFVHEIWYIVTQLTTYHAEIGETPRFPLETLLGGGGDCEDMAILVASMLKAAPADYIIKLVYMDRNNPENLQELNHVIVQVETPSGYKTFIEGTSNVSMCPFTLVDGWYLEVE